MFKKEKSRFLYRGHAVGLGASFIKPYAEHIEAQASCAIGAHGGTAKARVDNFKHRDIVSFTSAYSTVIGVPADDAESHGTVIATTVEGLNVMNMVTADRVVVRLAARHYMDGKQEASMLSTGSHIDNLKIAGHPVTITYDPELLSEWDTWAKVEPGAKRRSRGVITTPEYIYSSIVSSIEAGPGVTVEGNRIDIPEFGSIYLGEMLVKKARRKLTMIRIALGCATHGDVTICDSDNNGTPVPPMVGL